jgi:hypothetical protein
VEESSWNLKFLSKLNFYSPDKETASLQLHAVLRVCPLMHLGKKLDFSELHNWMNANSACHICGV